MRPDIEEADIAFHIPDRAELRRGIGGNVKSKESSHGATQLVSKDRIDHRILRESSSLGGSDGFA